MFEEAKLRAVLETAPPESFQGVVTRFVFEQYRTKAGSPEGARRFAGRYNPQGIAALYTSLRRNVALEEFTTLYDDSDPVGAAAMLSIIVRVERLLDLTRPALLKAIGSSYKELTGPQLTRGTSETQLLGKVAHDLQFDGLLVWSAAVRHERNVVVFPENSPFQTPYLVVRRVGR